MPTVVGRVQREGWRRPFEVQHLPIVRYVGAGAGANILVITVFAGLHELFPQRDALLLSFCSSLLVMPASYAVNRRLVFGSTAPLAPELIRFCAVYLSAMALGLLIFAVLLRITPTPVVVTQILAIAILVTLSFLTHSFWTFSRGGHRTRSRTVPRELEER
jgi:putative flippase GtrA